MADEASAGAVEATHAGDPAPAAPSSAAQAAADAMSGADPLDLLSGSPDVDAEDVLSVVAELSAGPRRARGRGRPVGATNRKSRDMVAYLAALGHRDPLVTLSMIQTADTRKLAQMLGTIATDDNGVPLRDGKGELIITPASPVLVLGIQRQAAKDMLDYVHAKKPQQLELPGGDGGGRPVLAIGQLNVDQSFTTFMSAGIAPSEKVNEINGRVVRHGEALPHDDAKPSDINDLDA